MYEDLVKDLRELSHEFYLDDSDDYTEGKLSEAADAIEELQKAVYFHKYNSEFLEDKYNSLADERWIPVTERLPKEADGMVFVLMPDARTIQNSLLLIAIKTVALIWHIIQNTVRRGILETVALLGGKSR